MSQDRGSGSPFPASRASDSGKGNRGLGPDAGGEGPTSPHNWRWPLFPTDGETLDVDEIVRRATALLEDGDGSSLGTVLHWAHVLKSEQGPDGVWPAIVNARNGQPCSEERTRAPAALLKRLGDLLETTEFDAAVAFARAAM